MKLKTLGLLALAVGLTGCASTVQLSGESRYTDKDVTFPEVGTERRVKPGSLVHLRAKYSSRAVYRLDSPITMGFMLGKISAPAGELFAESMVDGKAWHCSERKLYLDPFAGPVGVICLTAESGGKFTQVNAAPGAVWFSRPLSTPASLTKQEVAWNDGGQRTKRELVLDGMSDGTLAFSERSYGASLTQPNQIRPHLFKIEALPMQVSVDGLELLVTRKDDDSVMLRLVRGWK